MDERPQRDIGEVAGGLTHSDPDARREAASQIRETGFARRVSLEKRGTVGAPAETPLADHELEALHAAAADDDRQVRIHAIEALGDFGDARSVSLLLTLLGEDDLDVRLAALDSLGDIGGSESLRALGRVAGDSGEPEDARLAALTELEELAAKPITSGPDRHFDPAQASVQPDPDEPDESRSAKAELVEVCKEIQTDRDVHGLLRLKAQDIQAYLESGIA